MCTYWFYSHNEICLMLGRFITYVYIGMKMICIPAIKYEHRISVILSAFTSRTTSA